MHLCRNEIAAALLYQCSINTLMSDEAPVAVNPTMHLVRTVGRGDV